jgi:Flp pilus assembly pilin Flp
MRNFRRKFFEDETGAVTVDWVVLTAAVIALVVFLFTIITRESLNAGAQAINDSLNEAAQYARGSADGELPEPEISEPPAIN